MEYISSDTNVWLDFVIIDRLELPFRLPYIYLMNHDAIEDELLFPQGLRSELLQRGHQKTELTVEELFLAEEYTNHYVKLSIYDCVALAIAKNRKITLLTGDGPLRKASKAEGVTVLGTIGILDQLYQSGFIEKNEYLYCLEELLIHNGGKVRLPEKELRRRIDILRNR